MANRTTKGFIQKSKNNYKETEKIKKKFSGGLINIAIALRAQALWGVRGQWVSMSGTPG